MADTNTVTIQLEEYFDLRQKAEMNGFLMTELGRIEARFRDIEARFRDMERWVADLEGKVRKCEKN